MSKGNFVDSLYVEDLNEFYLETGFCTVIEDGHAVSSFNENKVSEVVAKGYLALNDYGKEWFRNTMCIDMNDLYKEIEKLERREKNGSFRKRFKQKKCSKN